MDDNENAEFKGEDSSLCCGCEGSGKSKQRSPAEIKDLRNRLNRAEGQVRGIARMVESGAYCIDILTQVAAATSALNSFAKVLLANHIRTCVTEGIREGSDEKAEELIRVLQKLL